MRQAPGERSQCAGGWPIHRSACRIYNRSRSDFQTGSQPDDMVGIATTAESHKGSTLGIPFSPPTANSPADCAPASHCLGKAVSAIPTEVNVPNVPPTSTPISASAVRTRSQAVPRWRSVLFSVRKGANRTSHWFVWDNAPPPMRKDHSVGAGPFNFPVHASITLGRLARCRAHRSLLSWMNSSKRPPV